ncbi:unnamed protein product, partial [Mesorhabditis spiculigera]
MLRPLWFYIFFFFALAFTFHAVKKFFVPREVIVFPRQGQNLEVVLCPVYEYQSKGQIESLPKHGAECFPLSDCARDNWWGKALACRIHVEPAFREYFLSHLIMICLFLLGVMLVVCASTVIYNMKRKYGISISDIGADMQPMVVMKQTGRPEVPV